MADRKGRPRPKGPEFSGILNEPLQSPNQLALALQFMGSEKVQASRSRAIDDYLFQQRFRRIRALADYYGVRLAGSDGSFEVGLYKLLLKLAEDFVPGFKTEARRRPGRPRGTGKDNPWELAEAIKRLTTGNGALTVAAACTHLSRSSKSRWQGERPRALQERNRRFLAKMNKPSAIPQDLKVLYERLAKMGTDETHEN
jgi:hypothetical protein